MQVTMLAEKFRDYARDIRLNLSTVLTEEGSPGLTSNQIWGIGLACAYATRSAPLMAAVESDASSMLKPEELDAAKAAAVIMAMNNIYYRFLHLVDDPEFGKMPARLRMNVMIKPGTEKANFELMCLAVSAMAGCGACITAHIREIKKAGVSNEGCQSAVRIASVVNAAAQAAALS